MSAGVARMQALRYVFAANKTGPPLEAGVPAAVARQHQKQAQRVSDLARELKTHAQTSAPLWFQHGLKMNTKQVCEVLEAEPCILVAVVNSTEPDPETGWDSFVRIFKRQAGEGLATVAISQVVSPDEAADATARISEAFAVVVQRAQEGARDPIRLRVCHQLCSAHRAPGTKLFLAVSLKRSEQQSAAGALTPLWEVDASLFAAQAGAFENRGVHIDPSDPAQGMANQEWVEFEDNRHYMARVRHAEREDPDKAPNNLTERLTNWVAETNQLFTKAHSIPLALVKSTDLETAFAQARQAADDEYAAKVAAAPEPTAQPQA